MLSSVPEPKNVIYGMFDVRDPERIRYVGQTRKGVKRRLTQHWEAALYTKSATPRCKWLRKRVKDDVGLRTLVIADSASELDALEIEWIAKMRAIGQADLNVTDGGHTVSGMHHSPDGIARMKVARAGKGNAFYGHKHTAEALLQMSETLTAMRGTQEWKDSVKARPPRKGLKLTCGQVAEIRKLSAAGVTGVSLAGQYGVTPAAISDITRRKTWKNVA